MAAPSAPKTPVVPSKPHASRGAFTLILAASALFVGVGALSFVAGLSTFGISYIILGALGIWYATYGRAVGVAVQLVNRSLDFIGQGRFAESEQLLAVIEARFRYGVIMRLVYVHRAMIAMRRGDTALGIEQADRAIAVPLGIIARYQRLQQRLNAVGIRALLRASSGDRDAAAADAELVRKALESGPQALARATLAQAILLERSGDREALRLHLDRERALLLEATDPRERAILRAYQRMLKVRAASVYRKGAEERAGEEPPLAEWVAKVAPGAAAFVAPTRAASSGATPSEDALPAPTDEAKRKVLASRTSATRGSARRALFVYVAIAIIAVVAIAYVFTGSSPDATDDGAQGFSIGGLVAVCVAAIAGAIAIRVRAGIRGKAQLRRLQAALTTIYRGRVEDAERALEALCKGTLPLIAAQAFLARAQLAERRGDADAMLAMSDAGLGQISRYATRMAASDVLLPTLVAERALALTLLDRHDEARAEVASLNPAYPFLARARFRVRLTSLARQGDLAGALRLDAARSMDLPLGPRDEMLADVVRAAAAPESVGANEIDRLKEELRIDADARRWIDRVAPDLLPRLEAHADAGESAASDAEAEAEVAAEDEASREASDLPPRLA